MAVTTGKKKKLFQVATELNLAMETIREFLEKKGIAVTNPNMRINEEVYDLILKRFSFEKKEADKIHKRREERIREEVDEAKVMLQPSAEEPEPAEIPEQEEAAYPEDEAKEVEPEAVEEPEEKHEEKTEEALPVEEAVEMEEEAGTELQAAVEPETGESEAEEEEGEKPRVGDIIDHPVAKQFLERQKREEEIKKERQKKALERIKKKEEKPEKRKGRKKTKEEDRPEKLPVEEKIDVAELQEDELTIDKEQDIEVKHRERKKGKKKDELDLIEDKEARRRKAIEMIRRESKRIRPEMIGSEEETEPLEPKEKEGRRKRQKKKKGVDQKEVDSALKKTLAEMRDSGTSKKRRKKAKVSEDEELVGSNLIKVTEFISTQNLANLLDVQPSEIIRKCLELGLVVTINQRLDMDTIRLLAEEFGYQVEEEEKFGSDYLETISEEEDKPEDLQSRPPVVTIMGHVDHGKTSLLDYIRHTNIVAGESGGITQHIGAYEVALDNGRNITFLDTPGHEAFTAMRARGAQVTDIVVLVVAADDKVMPQTEEAIDHAKAAGVSIVIAINKMDKPDANPEAVRQQLAERNILVEDWGGNYQCVEVSAKTGQNVSELLEKILLESELLDLKANPNKLARGVVLEALLDKGKGPVATVLVEEGTLTVGECFVIGQHWGRVRAMLNERNQRVDSAGPSAPIQILGTDGIPEAGDRIIVMNDEQEAREIAQHRQQLKREQDFRQRRLMTLDELSRQIKAGDVKELKILVKADVDGSAQAIADSLSKLSTDTLDVQIIRRAVGPIAESDVILAAASEAIIIGFNVRPTIKAKELSEQEHVDIRLYKVIYDAIDDVEKALEGMLEPIKKEVAIGTAEVREVFKISRIGTVAGCYILKGKITRNSNVRLIRNDVEIYDGKLSSLKRFKDDAKEVQSSYECGLTIENFNDIKQGDIIEAYEIVMEAQTLTRTPAR
jgi:translation initiation factor IF-2